MRPQVREKTLLFFRWGILLVAPRPKVVADESTPESDHWRENRICPVNDLIACLSVADIDNEYKWQQHDRCDEAQQGHRDRFDDFCPLRRIRRDLYPLLLRWWLPQVDWIWGLCHAT